MPAPLVLPVPSPPAPSTTQGSTFKGTQCRKTRNAEDKRKGKKKERKKRKQQTQNNHKQGNPSPEGAGQTRRAARTATGKGEAHQNAPGRPACLTRPGKHAQAHTHATRAWRPLTRKGRFPCPHETALVHRLRPPSKDGRYGTPDKSVIGSTKAHHRSARSPRPTPEELARDNPIAGPRTGTTRSEPTAPASAAAMSRHKEPGSRPASTCPAQPPSKSGGASPQGWEKQHCVGKVERSTESDRTGEDAAHQRRATRHAREARRR